MGRLICLVLLALMVLVEPAFAADTYVDQALGNDANLCVNPALPCATIAAALAKAGNTNTVHVAPGLYSEQVDLNGDKLLDATGTPASTIITAPTSPTIHVTGAGGSVDGFTIETGESTATTVAMQADAPAEVIGNVFDTDSTDVSPAFVTDLRLGAGAAASLVSHNSFVDDGVGDQRGIETEATGSQTAISDNQIAGLERSIDVQAGSPQISRNVITGWHEGPAISVTSPTPAAGSVTPTLTANYLHAPGAAAEHAIEFVQTTGGGVGGTLSRNRIFGGSAAVAVSHSTLAVTFSSDLLTGATTGLSVGSSTVTVTNATIFSNGGLDVALVDSTLTMDSSVIENPISHNGATTCTITNSAGSTVAAPQGCTHFDRLSDISDFADANLHLASNSPLIDTGNSTAPPAGSLDFDSDPRVNPECIAGGSPRRDIGADELYPGCGSSGASISSPSTNGTSTDASASFSFSGGIGGGGPFQCSLDGSTYETCSSPASYEGLASGTHVFAVRNVGSNGSRLATTRTINVDGSDPESDVTVGPANGATLGPSSNFTFSSEPNTTFQCSLDGAAFASCPSPFALNGLSEGPHTLLVRAVDAVGNVDPTPVSTTWTVDATPPDTSIDSGPADGISTTETAATYGFSAEAGATFECSVDGAAFTACTSPQALTGLALGSHAFAVRATDIYGNVDATPASRALTVTSAVSPPPPAPPGGGDTKAPETTIAKVKVKRDTAKVKFASDEAGSTFECKLDKGEFKPCSSPARYRNLDEGRHKFQVQATDAAGNKDPSPAHAKFHV